MKILIVTSCTSEKKHKPESQLTLADFENLGSEKFKKREKELAEYGLPASEMYTGQQHLRLIRGVEMLRGASGNGTTFDLKILSAGYGLLDEHQPILPYEATFTGMKAKALRQWADKLNIPGQVKNAVQDYDLTLFLLGETYLRAINFPALEAVSKPLFFLAGQNSLPRLPKGDHVHAVCLNNKDARRIGAGLVALKGRIVEILGALADADPSFIETVVSKPEQLMRFIQGFDKSKLPVRLSKSGKTEGPKKEKKPDKNAQLRSSYDARVIQLPAEWLRSSHRKKIRYFIPEWDDLVNPVYDFENDVHPEGTGDAYEFGHYSHQLFDTPPYDGILVSKIVVEMKKKKKEIFEKLGVHRYLRVPRDFPIMGDCGAFGYIADDDPPYQTDEILDYYQRMDFDYGVSIDHLIVDGILKRDQFFMIDAEGTESEISKEKYEELKESGNATEIKSPKRQVGLFESAPYIYHRETIDEGKRDYRYNLTMQNARDFIEGHRKGGLRFVPVGAVQGWSPDSYAEAVGEYQKMGYRYLALGGLVRTQSNGILQVLEAVNKVLKQGVDLHLFGVARPDVLEEMHRLGITSVDSASFLRRAWLGAAGNYHMPDGKYAAIRIPQAEKSPRAKKMVREGRITLEGVQALEEKCLRLVRDYDRGNAQIDDVMEAVMEYDGLMGGNRGTHEQLIRKTLQDSPWKKCTCRICREWGVEVIIFRGNNRNRRRGFHNTKVFYDQFRRMFGEE